MTDTIYELKELRGTVQSALDSLGIVMPESKEVRMLTRLLRERPLLASRRFYCNVTQAEDAGEVGVTEPLRVPVFESQRADMDFIDMAVMDMKRDPSTEWSIVMEDEGHRYPAISIWRVPSPSYIFEE